MTEHTEATTPPRRPYLPLNDFGAVVDRHVKALGHGYVNDRATEVAALAQLRQAYGKPIGMNPTILSWTVQDLPDRGTDPDSGPSAEERAAHTAVTLYAIHQQSHRNASIHQRGDGFGYAAAQLVRRTSNVDGVLRRFRALGTASDWSEVITHARGLIQLFRAEGIALDYAAFAQDLVALQNEATSAQVRLRWGRDFHRNAPAIASKTPQN